MQKFNRLIKNRQAKMFNFPSASSHQLLHYRDVYLNDKAIFPVIMDIGINDLMTNSSRSSMGNLISNIKKVIEKCLIFLVKNAFITGLVYLKVHVLILDFCRKNCFIYIDNTNIRGNYIKMGFS